MSNNAPDYEDNLVFPPQDIKSQDDIKRQDARSSDVLIKAVEKCEKLEKQLKIAVEGLKILECNEHCVCCSDGTCFSNREAKRRLEQIKELDNGK